MNISKNKYLLLAFIVLVIIFAFALYQSFFKKNSPSVPTSSNRPNENFNEDIIDNQQIQYSEFNDKPLDVVDESNVDGLNILSMYPGAGTVLIWAPRTALGFRFNLDVNPESVFFRSEPEFLHNVSYDEENRIVYIEPLEDWIYNVSYAISIQVSSVTGEQMEKTFKTIFTPSNDYSNFDGLQDEHSSSGEL